jgi:hypothetical protein
MPAFTAWPASLPRPARAGSVSSSCLICCDSVGCETYNASPRVKLPWIGDRDEVAGVTQKHKQRL